MSNETLIFLGSHLYNSKTVLAEVSRYKYANSKNGSVLDLGVRLKFCSIQVSE